MAFAMGRGIDRAVGDGVVMAFALSARAGVGLVSRALGEVTESLLFSRGGGRRVEGSGVKLEGRQPNGLWWGGVAGRVEGLAKCLSRVVSELGFLVLGLLRTGSCVPEPKERELTSMLFTSQEAGGLRTEYCDA